MVTPYLLNDFFDANHNKAKRQSSVVSGQLINRKGQLTTDSGLLTPDAL